MKYQPFCTSLKNDYLLPKSYRSHALGLDGVKKHSKAEISKTCNLFLKRVGFLHKSVRHADIFFFRNQVEAWMTILFLELSVIPEGMNGI